MLSQHCLRRTMSHVHMQARHAFGPAYLIQENLSTKDKTTGPVTKEDLGRATWRFLHTLAAKYPEKPTKQQNKDVKDLMAILSRMYPSRECAD
ncbi:hypothetical protein ARALYDRAFT_892010 [Arabidopsis lyrata subsp. lyrata]|uniref:Sulfhydryl oxidase n=1 Tax=Arabidopsis lyrata subsp. lyrata TaxID=81972 RepID=D7KGS1_ARALL|nr:hypothetical protein ARALYDRAFT_892010 [Arabidopsis lyrata subsp. lyrata]